MSCTKPIIKYLIGLLVLIFVAVGHAETDFDNLLKEAVAAQKKANSVGGEWRDVKKIIDGAKKAAAEGKHEEAMKLARKAKTQSELGYQQAIAQQGKIQLPSYLQR